MLVVITPTGFYWVLGFIRFSDFLFERAVGKLRVVRMEGRRGGRGKEGKGEGCVMAFGGMDAPAIRYDI